MIFQNEYTLCGTMLKTGVVADAQQMKQRV
jgi:hypothetical protein